MVGVGSLISGLRLVFGSYILVYYQSHAYVTHISVVSELHPACETPIQEDLHLRKDISTS